MTTQTLKVMVVDDTALYRSILTRAVESLPGCTVVGTAANGELALAKMDSLQPDLVLLDCIMPVLGGLETLEQIKARYPRTVVVMVSGMTQDAANLTLQALRRGAVEFIPKPEGGSLEDSQRMLGERLRHVCEVTAQVIGQLDSRPVPAAPAKAATPAPAAPVAPPKPAAPRIARHPVHPVSAVAIGVSTGGPAALATLLPGIPADLGVPVIVVQHMPPYFTGCLAKSLAKVTPLSVSEVADGDILAPGGVYIAPGGRHLEVRRGELGDLVARVSDGAPVKNCRPSVDVMFNSLTRVLGRAVLAVVMTGMGDDGCDGVRALKALGAPCITQDRASCTVFGMPRAVEEAGLSDEQVPLANLAARITAIVRTPKGVLA